MLLAKNLQRAPYLKTLGDTLFTQCVQDMPFTPLDTSPAFTLTITKGADLATAHTLAVRDVEEVHDLARHFKTGAKRLYGTQVFNDPMAVFEAHNGHTWTGQAIFNAFLANSSTLGKQWIKRASAYDIVKTVNTVNDMAFSKWVEELCAMVEEC
ncbi:hypothetical protein [Vibrio phage R01]|nr:hypothetical protein [Vibrio phage R01]